MVNNDLKSKRTGRSRRQSKCLINNCHLVVPFFKKLTRRLVKRESITDEHFETNPIEELDDEYDETPIQKINNTPKHRFQKINFEGKERKSMLKYENESVQETMPGKWGV
jgi:hypothetical protein